MCGVYGQGHQHGEDLVREVAMQNLVICLVERIPGDNLDTGFGQGWLHTRVVHIRMAHLQFMGSSRNICEHICGGSANVGGNG